MRPFYDSVLYNIYDGVTRLGAFGGWHWCERHDLPASIDRFVFKHAFGFMIWRTGSGIRSILPMGAMELSIRRFTFFGFSSRDGLEPVLKSRVLGIPPYFAHTFLSIFNTTPLTPMGLI